MADYIRMEVTTVRVEYILPSPTNATEYAKAISRLTAELKDRGIPYYDDTVKIEGRDEEIVLSFEARVDRV